MVNDPLEGIKVCWEFGSIQAIIRIIVVHTGSRYPSPGVVEEHIDVTAKISVRGKKQKSCNALNIGGPNNPMTINKEAEGFTGHPNPSYRARYTGKQNFNHSCSPIPCDDDHAPCIPSYKASPTFHEEAQESFIWPWEFTYHTHGMPPRVSLSRIMNSPSGQAFSSVISNCTSSAVDKVSSALELCKAVPLELTAINW